MARIKHIAIATKDADRARDFYIKVLGMSLLRTVDQPKYTGYILSDGHLNLALLDYKQDDVAGEEWGAGFEGLHHIGVQVDPSEGVIDKLGESGFSPRDDINQALGVSVGGNYNPTHEFKYQGPDGVVIDISSVGWEGTDGWRGK